MVYQITTSDNQNNNQSNISKIDFGECEYTLKKIYNINMSIPLIIFKIDYFVSGSLIPIIGYEVYHPLNRTKLDLSYCNNTVNLNIPITINEDKLYQYDPSSDYYTDECSSYNSDDGTDILIYDRKKEYINNKLSLCENGCDYLKYEMQDKQSICNCKIKNNIEQISNKTNLLSNDFNISENDLGYTNIFTCTKNLFTINGLKKNISSYILLFSIFYFIFSIIFFCKCGYHSLEVYINNIINIKLNIQSLLLFNNNINKGKIQYNNKNDNTKKLKGNKKTNYPPKKSKSSKKKLFSDLNSNKSSRTKINKQINLNLNNDNNNKNK